MTIALHLLPAYKDAEHVFVEHSGFDTQGRKLATKSWRINVSTFEGYADSTTCHLFLLIFYSYDREFYSLGYFYRFLKPPQLLLLFCLVKSVNMKTRF